MGKETKDQHFLPKMYIKRFTYDGEHCYTLNSSNILNPQKTDEICKKKNIYELKTKDGVIIYRNLFEKKVFGEAENNFTPFFDELLRIVDNDGSIVDYLSKEDNRKCLLWFIASLLLRNKIAIKLTKEVGAECGFYWTEQQARNIGIIHNATMVIPFMHKLDKEFNVVVHINKTDVHFITADFPFIMLPIRKNSFADGFCYWPLSPQCLIILEPIWPTRIRMDKEFYSKPIFVDFINALFAISGNALLISNDKTTLEKIKSPKNRDVIFKDYVQQMQPWEGRKI